MRRLTIRSIALIVSLLSGIILAVSLYLLLHYEILWYEMAITVVIVFVVVYLLTFGVLLRVVVGQITPLYKTMYSVNTPKEKLKEKLLSSPISSTNKEVADWAEQKTKELTLLHKMERYRKEFIGDVSHELKTPIFNIQGYILTLLDGAIDDPSINRKYLERTENSINRLISIIEDLDSISKLEEGSVPLTIATFDMVKLVDELFEALEMKAKQRNIKLCYNKYYDEPVMVDGDRKKISQVLINLLVNSIHYGREGGKTQVSFSTMPGRVLIEVTDNGMGIDAKDIPRIFDRFYRVDKHRSREQGGSGLGLSIVKHIIEAHQQTINVLSEVGKGSTFAFTLNKSASQLSVRSLFTGNG